MSMSETTMLVMVSTTGNNNKFYEATINGDTIDVRYGRVGATGSTMRYGGGRAKYDSLLNSKKRKGYKEVEVVDGGNTKAATNSVLRSASLKGLSKPEFATDTRITKLVDDIVAVNAHSIATASGGKIALKDGALRTPLGVIGRSSLDKADALLVDINNSSDHRRKVGLLEDYLTLVPQKVGSRRGWEDDLLTDTALGQQVDFVKQLRDSLDFIETQAAAASDTAGPAVTFRYNIGVIEADDPRFKQVADSFAKTLNSNHPSRRYKLVGLYDMFDSDEALAKYEALKQAKGNEQWLWHGTRASNVLSILAKGLYVPPANAGFTTGRMFGNGVYLSSQSTKSALYSGGYWAGENLSNKAFMFSAQAVMGKSYQPRSYGENWAPIHRDYDSINVKAGTAGVRNHEAVIWNLDQLNMRYLLELSL